jgi:membrane protein implicated in regulation of membrane protease activity
MNPTTTNGAPDDILGPDDIRVEGKTWVRAERGEDMPKGYRVKIHREDGTIIEREVQIPF